MGRREELKIREEERKCQWKKEKEEKTRRGEEGRDTLVMWKN